MKETCKKHLHITYMGGSTWVYPIWNAVNKAEQENRIRKLSKELRNELGNVALAVSVKLDFLPFIMRRINIAVLSLYKEIKNRDKTQDQYAYEPKTANKLLLLIDIDSFLFDIYSCYELLEMFTKKILRRVCKKVIREKQYIRSLLKKSHEPEWWIDKLAADRGHFTHTGAPWIAVSLDDEPHYDLLIMKENIKDFSDPNKFVRLSEFSKIIKGFNRTLRFLQKHIVESINCI